MAEDSTWLGVNRGFYVICSATIISVAIIIDYSSLTGWAKNRFFLFPSKLIFVFFGLFSLVKGAASLDFLHVSYGIACATYIQYLIMK